MIVCGDLVGASDAFVTSFVQAMGEHDRLLFEKRPTLQSPFSAGVRYKAEPPSDSIRVLDAVQLYRQGFGACGSISCAVYGFLRARKHEVTLLTKRQSDNVWHVVVRLDTGQIWDPAKDLRNAA